MTEGELNHQNKIILETIDAEIQQKESEDYLHEKKKILFSEIECPVCHAIGRTDFDYPNNRSIYAYCKCCRFSPGIASSYEELLMRWLQIMETLNEPTDNETTKTA